MLTFTLGRHRDCRRCLVQIRTSIRRAADAGDAGMSETEQLCCHTTASSASPFRHLPVIASPISFIPIAPSLIMPETKDESVKIAIKPIGSQVCCPRVLFA